MKHSLNHYMCMIFLLAAHTLGCKTASTNPDVSAVNSSNEVQGFSESPDATDTDFPDLFNVRCQASELNEATNDSDLNEIHRLLNIAKGKPNYKNLVYVCTQSEFLYSIWLHKVRVVLLGQQYLRLLELVAGESEGEFEGESQIFSDFKLTDEERSLIFQHLSMHDNAKLETAFLENLYKGYGANYSMKKIDPKTGAEVSLLSQEQGQQVRSILTGTLNQRDDAILASFWEDQMKNKSRPVTDRLERVRKLAETIEKIADRGDTRISKIRLEELDAQPEDLFSWLKRTNQPLPYDTDLISEKLHGRIARCVLDESTYPQTVGKLNIYEDPSVFGFIKYSYEANSNKPWNHRKNVKSLTAQAKERLSEVTEMKRYEAKVLTSPTGGQASFDELCPTTDIREQDRGLEQTG